jgi:trans-2,3-dihydro-3-hydroxyanthranilate isomerase
VSTTVAQSPLGYAHVDVFASHAYAGNSLAVFRDSRGLNSGQMLSITQELRHFEAIFLEAAPQPNRYRARIFDLFEELPFAGHPVIGAAAALHHTCGDSQDQLWTFDLAEKSVTVTTRRSGSGYFGLLDQGPAEFLGQCDDRHDVAAAFDLALDDLDDALPLAVVSTGLRYLIIPVRSAALARANIRADITALVQATGAQFAVLFAEATLEMRHWNNDGIMEDVATGSAAGTIGAYRMRHCGAQSGMAFVIRQGRFVGRPSEISVQPFGTADCITSVKVGGDVTIVGHGILEMLP